MCGIAGFVDYRGLDAFAEQIMTRMTGTLARRGPDGRSYWSDTRWVAFGHTRLAILDLEGGGQPMTLPTNDEDQRLVLIFGGEVYNYVELRQTLLTLGHKFSDGDGDTEVLLHAWSEWGPACVERLDGMFAFAVWNAADRSLHLVRDRTGTKPLFYHQLTDDSGAPCGIVFGSEPQALQRHPDVSRRVDTTGLCELFAMTPMVTPGLTPFADIREVRPGHMLDVQITGVRDITYWQLEAAEHGDELEATVATVREHLDRIHVQQLRSHRFLGALLSGGVDSSAVAAFAQRQLPHVMDTFCIEYEPGDGDNDHSSAFHHGADDKWAQIVADHLGTRHHRVPVRLDSMMSLSRLTLDAMGWPSLPHVDVPLTALFQAISELRIPVVLSGEGADEIFGGYAMHHGPQHYAAGRFPWWSMYPAPMWMLNRDAYEQLRPDLYAEERYQLAREQVPVLAGEDRDARLRREAAHMVSTHYLSGFLLRRADRLAMANGIETRVPFCDHHLIEYMFNVPQPFLSGGGKIPKWLLRYAVRDLLPEDITWRPKSGFPVAQNLRYQADLYQRVGRQAGVRGPLSDLLDWPAIEHKMKETLGDVSNWDCMLHIGFLAELLDWQGSITLA